MDIQIPFSGFNQQAAFRHVFSCAIDPSDPGGVILSVRTGPTQVYASASYTNLLPEASPGPWTELELPLTEAPYVPAGQVGAFDPTQVDLIELAFSISAMLSTTVAVSAPMPATFHVDAVGFF
jgi:hypothetical protein